MPTEERYAYLVSRYPAVTHTFISEEVRALRALGVQIHTAAVRADPTQVLSAADERERLATHVLLPVGPVSLLRDHARAFAHAPGAYLRTLAGAVRQAPGGVRSRLWQVFYFAEAMLLWRWLSRMGLRHVHVHFPNVASDVADLAARFANASRPVQAGRWSWSITLHGPTEFADVEGHRLAAKVEAASAVIVISEFTRRQVEAVTDPAHHRKLQVVHCGVDTARFVPSPAARPASPFRLLNVAALSERKAHRDLLSAMADLRARGVDVTATIVGGGPEREALEAKTVELGLSDLVTFTGALAHASVHEQYAKADAFVLPSHAEGVPIVLMEAMACGLAVVATRINGIPELVVDERTGLLVEPGRPAEMAAAIERLAVDAPLRDRLARAGLEHVRDQYELHASAAAVREVLAGVTSPGR